MGPPARAAHNAWYSFDMAGKSQPITPEDKDQPTLASESLEAEAVKLLNENDFKLLQNIAVSIGQDGMTLQEACQLVNVEYDHMKELATKYPVIKKIISLKELEYKRSLMRSLSRKARTGDDKIATYLLETRYPEEFGKKKGGGEGGKDMLDEAVSFIQQNGDNTPLIANNRSVSVAPKTQAFESKSEAVKKLQGFLV